MVTTTKKYKHKYEKECKYSNIYILRLVFYLNIEKNKKTNLRDSSIDKDLMQNLEVVGLSDAWNETNIT